MRRLTSLLLITSFLLLLICGTISQGLAASDPCEDMWPDGWEHHPGLFMTCLLYMMQDQCGADMECLEDNWW